MLVRCVEIIQLIHGRYWFSRSYAALRSDYHGSIWVHIDIILTGTLPSSLDYFDVCAAQ